ncbi:DUF4097 family beta strand repeat-containing protein [Streptomyces kronopolitis]|uniref:DUF4097 family beta strand repeat-containing protein n=1 Tax=Streptomyces kronopolitis TaxID=1612435 RepID=UPI003D95D42B
MVGGSVEITRSRDSTCTLEIAGFCGAPLRASRNNGSLVLAHDKGSLLGILDKRTRQRRADISLSVPRHVELKVDSVSAKASLTDMPATAQLRSMSGSILVAGTEGNLNAWTSSGDMAISGIGGGRTVAQSTRGRIEIGVHRSGPGTVIDLASKHGDVEVEFSAACDMSVSASTLDGDLACDIEEFSVDGGCRRGKWASGHLGSGQGMLKAFTASGRITLTEAGPSASSSEPG